VKEWRESLVRTVEAPSGLTYQVRLLTSPLPFLRLLRKHGLEGVGEAQAESLDVAEKSDALLRDLFAEYVLNPKVAEGGGAEGEERLAFSEMLEEDKAVLFNAIAEKFRFLRSEDSQPPHPSPAGGSSPPPRRAAGGSLPPPPQPGSRPPSRGAGSQLDLPPRG